MTGNPYDDIEAGLTEQSVRSSALASVNTNPDTYATANAIAKRNGWPVDAVANDPAPFVERDYVNQIAAASQQSPAAARWFQTPEHAALAKDEPGVIGRLSATLSRTGDFISDAVQNLLPFQFDTRQRLNRLGTHLQAGEAMPAGGALQEAGEGANALLGALFTDNPRVRAVMAQVLPLGNPDARQTQAQAFAAKGADLYDFGQALSADASQGVHHPASLLEALQHPGNTFDYYGGITAESLPMMLASAPLGAAAGPLAAGVTTQAQSYGQYRSEGVAPGQAFGAAGAQGALEGLGEIVPFSVAFRRGSSFLRRAASTAAAEGVSEGATQLGQDEADAEILGRPITPTQRLVNMLDAFIVGVGMSAPLAAVGHGHDTGDHARSNAIEATHALGQSVGGGEHLADVVQQVQDSKLGKRSPDALHALVEQAAPDAKVYLSAEQARTLFQSDRASADQFLGELTGNPDALREAEATGGDVVIPMADFVAKVATLPNAADIAQHARLHPEHLSRAELGDTAALDEHLARIFGDTAEAADRADPQNAKPEASEQVTQDVLGMLLATDRYTPADAEIMAKLAGRIFSRAADATGQDTKALYDSYSVRINGRGAHPGKPNTLDPRTDALITAARTEIPGGERVHGPSLVSALKALGGVQDQGGELRARDAHKVRGLVNDTHGVPLDTARELMVEAGYLRDRGAEDGGTTTSGIDDLLDAINAELGGRPVYSPQFGDANLQRFSEDAHGIARGIEDTFHDLTPEQFAALSNQQIHDALFPPEPSLLQKAVGAVKSLFQSKPVAPAQSPSVEFAHAETDLKSRLEQWGVAEPGNDPLRGFGFDRRESAPGRSDGDAENADADVRGTSRERKTAAGHRLIEAAKTGGFFIGEDEVRRIEASAWNRAEGAEHDVRFVGGEGAELAIRSTANGNFGPMADILPSEYLQRLRDFNQVFPLTQIRVIGVSQDAEGNAVIWSAQPFVKGEEYASEDDLAKAMEAHGWERDGQFPRYTHKVSGAIIDDAHSGNILHIGDELFPIDVVVEKLPGERTLLQGKRGDYVGHHAAPGASFGTTADNLTGEGMYPEDVYGPRGARIYGHGDAKLDEATMRLLRSIRGKPDAKVTIYRAVPLDASDTINEGDWVTINREYAAMHGESNVDGYKIIEKVVRASEIFTNADSIHEWGYDPRRLFQPADGGGVRGRLRIGADRSMSIDLLKGADLSTFIHELGHLSLELMTDAAEKSEAVKADLDLLRKAVGNDGGAFTEDQHEQVARLFEAYVREGKAPAPEMRGMFARMRAWLLSIYRDLRQLNVTLTDEVRGVFDRMIATDEEIEAAQVRQGMQPLTLAPESRALVSDKQWEAYVASLQDATEEARAEVMQKLLAAHKREAQAWWKEQQAATREQVEAEFEAAPVVRAWRVLSGRKVADAEHLQGVRLDRESLVREYGERWVVDNLNRLGVYRKEGGVSADIAASMLGFPSGSALIKGLSAVRDLQSRITAEVDARMHERYPDPLTDGSLPERAMDAVHNVKRVAALEAELGIIAKLANEPAPPVRLVREYARRKIAGLTLRSLRPNDYLVAERKAARDYAKAAAQGDYAKALQHKRAQALNMALYAEARAVQKRSQANVRFLQKAGRPKSIKALGKSGADYVDGLKALLENYQLKDVPLKRQRSLATLRQWYDNRVAEGQTPIVDPTLMADIDASRKTHYMDLTGAQLQSVRDAVANLKALARGDLEATIAGQQVARQEIADGIAAGIRTAWSNGTPPPQFHGTEGWWAGKSRKAQEMGSLLLYRLEPVANLIDGDGNVDGWFHRAITRPLAVAAARSLDLNREYVEKMHALLVAHQKAGGNFQQKHVMASFGGRAILKGDLLAMALNFGNEGNLQRLRDGNGIGPVHIAEILSKLTQADADYLQGTWDLIDSLRPDIQAQYRRMTGLDMKLVDPSPVHFQSADGHAVSLRGGYFPIIPDRTSTAWQQVEKTLKDNGPFDKDVVSASTFNGFTQERAAKTRIPLAFDLASVPQHVSAVIHDLTHHEVLQEAWRVLHHPDVHRAFAETGSLSVLDMAKLRVSRVANGATFGGDKALKGLSRVLQIGSSAVTTAALGFNTVVMVKQVAGTINTLNRLAAVSDAKKAPGYLAKGFADMLRQGVDGITFLRESSGLMRHRLDTLNADMALNLQRHLALRTGTGLKNAALQSAGYLKSVALAGISYVQFYTVDVPEYYAALRIAADRGLQGGNAIAFAEEQVSLAQGSARKMDLANIEDTPMFSPFTRFYSFFSAQLNEQVALGKKVARSKRDGELMANLPTLAARGFTLMVLGPIVNDLLDQAFGRSPGPPDDDKEGALLYYLRMMAASWFGGIPLARDVANAAIAPGGYTYKMSPVQDMGDSFVHTLKDWEKIIDPSEEVDAHRLISDSAKSLGYLTGLPLAYPARQADYVVRVLTGEEQPESASAFWKALLAGKRPD